MYEHETNVYLTSCFPEMIVVGCRLNEYPQKNP
jgi:hypothetical protein